MQADTFLPFYFTSELIYSKLKVSMLISDISYLRLQSIKKIDIICNFLEIIKYISQERFNTSITSQLLLLKANKYSELVQHMLHIFYITLCNYYISSEPASLEEDDDKVPIHNKEYLDTQNAHMLKYFNDPALYKTAELYLELDEIYIIASCHLPTSECKGDVSNTFKVSFKVISMPIYNISITFKNAVVNNTFNLDSSTFNNFFKTYFERNIDGTLINNAFSLHGNTLKVVAAPSTDTSVGSSDVTASAPAASAAGADATGAASGSSAT